MPLKFIYATDLHGDIIKYEDVFAQALEHDVELIHLGADILPKGSGIFRLQKQFINCYLKDFYQRCGEAGIKVLSFFGNDDIPSGKKHFLKYAPLLDETPCEISGYEFKAYGYVPDLPFGMKTACKLDHKGWKRPTGYYGESQAWEAPSGAICDISDLDKYFEEKGTIEDDLKDIKAGDNTIMAIHSPPQALELDVCMDGRRVGSKSVAEWVKKQKPTILLCGHIHESYQKSKIWKVQCGQTLIIQPGQTPIKTTIVLIEIHKDKISSSIILV